VLLMLLLPFAKFGVFALNRTFSRDLSN